MSQPSCRLNIIIVGAGLGGLGAAISLLRSGHSVLLLEAAQQISEIGAGIQCHPNAVRILRHWGLEAALRPYITRPECVNLLSWRGELLSSLPFGDAEQEWGAPFWDLRRSCLQKVLLQQAEALGARVRCAARVVGFLEAGGVLLDGGETLAADLVVGADGIYSKTREALLGRADPPRRTGDLAYRLLLDTQAMMADPDLAEMVKRPQVNYWLGPQKHAVTYALRGGTQLNIVLLVPDDMPDTTTVTPGNIDEMRAHYAGWDPRITKLLGFADSVHKWKLCISNGGVDSWSNAQATFVLLGDAVHAALPYLGSGAGMALEDAAFLGLVLGKIRNKAEVKTALKVYERARRNRTDRIIARGNVQQHLYHLPDGPEQQERDRRVRLHPTPDGEAMAWRDPGFAPFLLAYDVVADVEREWEAQARASVRSSLL
ncbi:FAD dependent oxidoreductase [Sphaerosporella brunnea]|uniref:FAD dependent oxidoreductase n=1 Tax=Sphaerosporella brunnea TaxID=1250544 RepID=A0A5J5F0U6_9PEZI|nr:FAD dependent oxidoreductase [Sphaerosporella brunnea]